MSRPIPWLLAALAVCVSISARNASAGRLDEIGYIRLLDEQGAALPTGESVAIAHVEATNSSSEIRYLPNLADAEFVGKNFTVLSGESAVSSHANSVGKYIYGATTSPAPGVVDVYNYFASDWLGEGFYHASSNGLPNFSPARVANHSWISTTGGSSDLTKRILYRADWLVENDDFVQVVGINNLDVTTHEVAPAPIFATAMNVIAVGMAYYEHSPGTVAISGSPYVSGRARPHIVAPGSATSFSTAYVSGAAAMLIDGAHQHTEWSNGFVTSSTGRNNWILANAETSEVTRSLLMAGADRRATFGSRTYAAVPNSGGLDVALGAGLLDVYSSYHMLAAGEQESVEAGGGDIKMYGFDYQPSIITLQSKKYRFSIDSAERDFAASLNWNMKIDWTQSGTTFTAKPRVSIFNQPADLDLELYDVSGAVPVLIADSSGNLDTTENIYVANLGPGDYELRVNYALTPWGLGVDGAVDYGLAWRFAPSAAPLAGDVNLDGVVNLSDMAAIQAHLGMTKHAVWTDGDLNLDGRVDRRDLGRFRLNLAVPNVSPVAAGAPIPEPASFFSLLTGAAMAFAFRRCKLGSNRFDA